MVMTPANKAILEITPYKGGDSKLSNVDKIYRLASNECPYGPSPKAVALMQEIASTSHRYPDGGAHELRQELALSYGIEQEQIICGAGSDEILSFICAAYVSPGDEVIYTEHGFLMYRISTLVNGGTPVSVAEKGLKADIDTIIAAVTENTKVVFIANPNNPTGSYLTKAELAELHAQLPKHILLVIDGAYREYVDKVDYSDGCELVASGNVMVTGTFSKAFGLGGLRVGWGYASPEILDILNRIRGPFNVSGIALAAATASLKDKEWLNKVVEENNKLIPYVTEQLEKISLKAYPTVGNFILVDFGEDDKAIAADEYLRENGVIIRRVAAYGLPSCLRITIGTKEDMDFVIANLTEFMQS